MRPGGCRALSRACFLGLQLEKTGGIRTEGTDRETGKFLQARLLRVLFFYGVLIISARSKFQSRLIQPGVNFQEFSYINPSADSLLIIPLRMKLLIILNPDGFSV